jgi:hypothetical protein
MRKRSNYFAVAAGLVIAMPAHAQTKDPFTVAQTKAPPFTLAQANAQTGAKTTVEFPPGTSDSGGTGTNTEAEPTPKKTTTTTKPKTTTTTTPPK